MSTNTTFLMHNNIEDEISGLRISAKQSAIDSIYFDLPKKKERASKFKSILKSLTAELEQLNNSLYKNLNEIDDNTIRESILPELEDLSLSFLSFIGNIYSKGLFKDIGGLADDYIEQCSILVETIYDLKNIRLAENNELDMLLKTINSHK